MTCAIIQDSLIRLDFLTFGDNNAANDGVFVAATAFIDFKAWSPDGGASSSAMTSLSL